jgi:hypothetical protein
VDIAASHLNIHTTISLTGEDGRGLDLEPGTRDTRPLQERNIDDLTSTYLYD